MDLKPTDAPAANQEAATAQALHGEAQKVVPLQDIPAEWWTLFHSPQIDALIKRAFKINSKVEAAQAVLRQAQEYSPVQGFLYPSVGESQSPSRAGQAGNMGGNSHGQKGNDTAYYNIHLAQLTVGYVPDVFGADLQGELLQARVEMQQEAIYLTLACNVVAAAIQEASLRALIEAQLKIVSLNRQALEIMHNQLNLGYVSEKDVTQQEMTAALSQQALVPLQQQLEQTRGLLRVLAGNAPDEMFEEAFALEDLHLEQELPQSLSSKLVQRRPDVRIAEAQLHYTSAQYGVAVAKTLPQFSITGAKGGLATSPTWMIRDGGRFFDLNGNVAKTIFGERMLRAKPRTAQQGLTRAGAQYRSVVMVAVQNVADTMYVIRSDARALKATEKLALAASKKGELARKRYEDGSEDFQTLLIAQQNEQAVTINLVRARTKLLGDTLALLQALGGGWWNHEKDKAVAKQP